MRIKDYLNGILNIVAANPHVKSQSISFEERPPNAAYITGTVTFFDLSKLYFKEFVVFKTKSINIFKYGYSYLGKDDTLIFRYDNAFDPKAKKLSTYPEHKHISKKLLPAKRPTFKEMLEEISELFQNLPDLKAIEDRINEPAENYEAYSRKRKSRKDRD
ncbi:MAG: DUF6516 family protein [Nitrospirota bacterium]